MSQCHVYRLHSSIATIYIHKMNVVNLNIPCPKKFKGNQRDGKEEMAQIVIYG
jgi:hypothetical protein